VKRWWL